MGITGDFQRKDINDWTYESERADYLSQLSHRQPVDIDFKAAEESSRKHEIRRLKMIGKDAYLRWFQRRLEGKEGDMDEEFLLDQLHEAEKLVEEQEASNAV
jgi:hypothetical protein